MSHNTNETGTQEIEAPDDPASVPLSEAVTWLRKHATSLTEALASGQQCVWTGSAISRSSVPDLESLLRELINYLTEHADWISTVSCPYIASLTSLFERCGITEIDPTDQVSFTDADTVKHIASRLANDYASALDLRVYTDEGELTAVDDILNLADRFSAPSASPDAEHRLLALLFAERAITDHITVNWDVLFEKALQETLEDDNFSDYLRVIAGGHDLVHVDCPSTYGTLVKIHGCAKRAQEHPDKYSLVATETTRSAWAASESNEWTPVKEQVRTLIRRRPVLFIGFSARDYNLRNEFPEPPEHEASTPLNLSRIIFADRSVGYYHELILQKAYGPLYNENRLEIQRESTIPLFSKPILSALYHCTIIDKATALSERVRKTTGETGHTLSQHGVALLDTELLSQFDLDLEIDEAYRRYAYRAGWWITRLTTLAVRGHLPSDGGTYFPLINLPATQIRNPTFNLGNYSGILMTMGILAGLQREFGLEVAWNMGPGSEGHLSIEPTTGQRRVFLVMDQESAINLSESGNCDMWAANGSVLLHATGVQPKHSRAFHPRTRRQLPDRNIDEPLELFVEEIVEHSGNVTDALEQCRQEMGLGI